MKLEWRMKMKGIKKEDVNEHYLFLNAFISTKDRIKIVIGEFIYLPWLDYTYKYVNV